MNLNSSKFCTLWAFSCINKSQLLFFHIHETLYGPHDIHSSLMLATQNDYSFFLRMALLSIRVISAYRANLNQKQTHENSCFTPHSSPLRKYSFTQRMLPTASDILKGSHLWICMKGMGNIIIKTLPWLLLLTVMVTFTTFRFLLKYYLVSFFTGWASLRSPQYSQNMTLSHALMFKFD